MSCWVLEFEFKHFKEFFVLELTDAGAPDVSEVEQRVVKLFTV